MKKDIKLYNKSQKFVLLLQKLQKKEGVFASKIKQEFDLDDRTLRRYLHDLREIDLPIQSDRVKNDDGDRDRKLWLDAKFQRSGVQISLLEWVSLHFGRTLFDFLKGTDFAQDLDDALERLSTLAGDMNRQITRNMDLKFMAIPEHAKDYRDMSDVIEEILSALLYQNPAEAFYTKISGPTRKYVLHPYTLVTYRHSLYLFAYDAIDKKVKTFALDRFRHFKRIRGKHFTLPERYHPQYVVKDAFGIMGGDIQDVELRFSSSASPYIQERIWHHSQQVQAVENGELILKMKVAIAPELKSWILGFGPDVRVLQPTTLAVEIQKLHHRAAQQQQQYNR